MKMLEKLLDFVMDEIKGADEYTECAAKYKENDAQLFKVFADMANAELQHAEMLLKAAKDHAQKHSATHPDMMVIYNFEAERLYRWHNKVKSELATLRM